MITSDLLENFELDPSNVEFQQAVNYVLQTNKNLFLTGKAGTGKTTFLNYIRTVCPKNIAVVAPTGIAAIKASGQTIHSFFKLNFRNVYMPGDPRLQPRSTQTFQGATNIYEHLRYTQGQVDMLQALDVLIIDEISMVPPFLLDTLDTILRVYRKQRYEPFGGVQIVMVGDLFQLPAVVSDAQTRREAMRHYASFLPLDAKVFTHSTPINLELKKIYRQKDMQFIDILNRIRLGDHTAQDLLKINSRLLEKVARTPENGEPEQANGHSSYLHYWMSPQPQVIKPEDGVIQLVSTNNEAVFINEHKYFELNEEEFSYEATVDGIFPTSEFPAEEMLNLKVGTQVMVLKNFLKKGIYNGMIGIVKELTEDTILIDSDGREIVIERTTWDCVRYKVDARGVLIPEVIGVFCQFPLRYAWAITVHKSQGMTFKRAHLKLDRAFTSGQVYVALSRCTSLEGITLQTPVRYDSIRVDSMAIKFNREVLTTTQVDQRFQDDVADYYYREARQCFIEGEAEIAMDNLQKAMRLRNDMVVSSIRMSEEAICSKIA